MFKPDETTNNNQENTSQTDNASQTSQDNQPQEVTIYKNLFLRCTADLQNFQRRVEKERSEWSQIIQAEVLGKILPIADDFERALEHMPAITQQNDQIKQTLDGFALIFKNFKKVLTDAGVEEIQKDGQFNPEMHEALMHVESQTHESGHIVQTLNKGYLLNGKVIRYAKVSVAK